jgi:uncharacterized protein (TIGR03382 family)
MSLGTALLVSASAITSDTAGVLAQAVGLSQALARTGANMLFSIHAVAYWPLMALLLYWLGRRRQDLYVRGAVALLLSSLLSCAVLTGVERLPVLGASLVVERMSLPDTYAGWYVLMAFVLHAATPAVWLRVGGLASAIFVVTSALLAAEHHAVSGLVAAVLPVLSWYLAALLVRRHQVQGTERSVVLRRNGWAA